MGAKYYLQYVFVQIDKEYQVILSKNEQNVVMVIIHKEELEEGSAKGTEIIIKILWFTLE